MMSSGRQTPARWSARPSSTHSGTPWRMMPRGMMSNSKMCVSSWVIRRYSPSGSSSIGSTMRLRAGSANAPTPSGLAPGNTFCCSNSLWVLKTISGTAKARSCRSRALTSWYALSA